MASQESGESAPQQHVESVAQEVTESKPEASQAAETESTPSTKAIFDLLMSMQKSQQKIESRLEALEASKASPRSSTFEMVDKAELNEKEEFIGAIDQGTTSSRFLIFNKDGEPVASHQMEFRQIYPNPG